VDFRTGGSFSLGQIVKRFMKMICVLSTALLSVRETHANQQEELLYSRRPHLTENEESFAFLQKLLVFVYIPYHDATET